MWQVALIVLCRSVPNKDYTSVTTFYINIGENGDEKKRQRVESTGALAHRSHSRKHRVR